jgi:hypothetical protein
MKNNLLPPFILQETGIKLNDTPKTKDSGGWTGDR